MTTLGIFIEDESLRMLPGPVFAFELMATSRRVRFYLVRASYAVVLFLILWLIHSAWLAQTQGELSSRQVKWFAISAFGGIAVGQLVLALALTPALVAGVIADERQRKTLHYLLASRLTSAEIVLGKLLARLLYLAVLLGVSVPILSLLVLLGGVDPMLIVLLCATTFSTAFFLAALSIWVSTIANRVREAFFVAYGLEALWLFSRLILRNFTVSAWPALDTVVDVLADWIGASSPFDVARELVFGLAVGTASVSSELEVLLKMIALQVGFGLLLATLAAAQLRPIFRRQDGGGGVRALRGLRGLLKTRSRWRLWHRPVLADRPMIWKEIHTGGPSGFARIVGFLLVLIGGSFLVYYTYQLTSLAITEMWEYGYASSPLDYKSQFQRWKLLWFLRGIVPLLYLISILAVAGAAAASVTSEHEEDTWVSLTATDLTAREIVFAKILGALRRQRAFAAVIIVLVALGAVAGAVDVVAIPAMVVALPIYGWFAAALGVWISIHLRSTWRAQFLTVASLLLINVAGQGTLNALSRLGFAPQVWPGFTPYEVSKLVFEPEIIRRLKDASWPFSSLVWKIDEGIAWLTTLSVLSALGYAMLAAALTSYSLYQFEVVAGRARRKKSDAGSSTLAKRLKASSVKS